MNAHTRFSRIAALLTLLVLATSGLQLPAATLRVQAMPAQDTPGAAVVPSAWIPQGPAPALNGQQNLVNIAAANEPVSGSLGGAPYSGGHNLIVASPTDPNTIYVGADGGIWKTTNALAASPTWTPLLDDKPSLVVSGLSADPTDATFQTLLAGTDRAGLYRTTDGGASWTPISNPTIVPSGYTGGYRAVIARGNTLLVAAGTNSSLSGLFRTTDGGTSWTKISGTSGLPNAPADGLVGDPAEPKRLYVMFKGANGGIFRSDDTGATWTNISTGITIISSATDYFDAAVFNNGTDNVVTVTTNGSAPTTIPIASASEIGTTVTITTTVTHAFKAAQDVTIEGVGTGYNGTFTITSVSETTFTYNAGSSGLAPVDSSGTARSIAPVKRLFRSRNGAAFTALDTPTGNIKFISADKTNPNLVYMGGYESTVARVDSSQPSGSQVTYINKVSSTPSLNYGAPHVDYVAFAVDANGRLLAGSHGGLYRLPQPGSPASATNYWVPIMGNIGAFQFDSITYDHTSNVILGGSQDNGNAHQPTPGSQTWTKASGGDGDGGDVVVDHVNYAGSGQTARYQSSQNLGGFARRIYSAAGALVGSSTTISTSAITDKRFFTPLAHNAIDPKRFLVGGSKNLYETLDEFGKITSIAPVAVGGKSMAYGGYRNGVANPDVLYFSSGSAIYRRTEAGGPVTQVAALPSGVGTVAYLAMDPNDWMRVFVVDTRSQVYQTSDGGSSWSNITGNLKTTAGSVGEARTIAVVPGAAGYLAVGSDNGVFAATLASLGASTPWARLGTGLPRVRVSEIVYDATDDVLVMGTYARGAFTLPNARHEFNTAPTVALSGPTTAAEGDTASYTFTVSDANTGDTFTVDSPTVSPGGTLVAGSLITTTTGGSFQVSFADGPASPSISLVANDSYGEPSSTATRAVTVTNVAPTAAILGAPSSGAVGTPITLGSSVTDPGTADTSAGFTLAWSVTRNGSPFASGSEANFSFTPNAAATYVVTLNATDKNGATGSATATITTASSNLTANALSVTVDEGATATNSGTYRNLNGNALTFSVSPCSLTTVPIPIHFFRGEGNANDTGTPGGVSGTINGAVNFTPGRVGQAFNFPGSGGVVASTPNVTYPASDFAPGTGDFSVAFGIKTTASGPNTTVLGNRGTSSGGNFLSVRITSSGSLVAEIAQDSSLTGYIPIATTVPINDGQFHHVVVTRQGTTLKLYLDGSLNVSGSSSVVANITGEFPFKLGADNFTTPFTGLLDEVRIYNQALSPATITQDYKAFGACTVTQTRTLFADTFDSETQGFGKTTLSRWNVTVGNVDVIGPGLADIYPGNGNALDMGGFANATIQSKTTFALAPGVYQLKFEIGNNPGGTNNRLRVTLGSAFDESFAAQTALTPVVRQFSVSSAISAQLVFAETGPSDPYGSILDDVKLVRLDAPFGEPNALNVLGYWQLGEDDPGAADGVAGNSTTVGRDASGLNPARNLPRLGNPAYTSSVPATSGSTLAMNFDGTDDGYVGPQVTSIIDNFGIEAWVNPAASAASQQIIIHNGAPFNANGYGFEIFDGRFQGEYGYVRHLDTGIAATPGVWRHLALVRASGVTTIYVDGVAVYQNSSLAAPATPEGSSAIGRAPGGAPFTGAVDDERIFTFAPGTFNPQDLLINTPSSGAWSWSYTTNDGTDQPQEITITASTGVSGETTSLPFTLIIKNVAPTAGLSNGGAVREGSAGSVAFSGQSDPSTVDTAAGFHYAYDFDNDGRFESGDGTYDGSGTAAAATVPASFLADGPGTQTVRGRIIDKDNGFTDYTTTIMVNNATPTASASGPAAALAGQLVTFRLQATDASPSDQAAGFTYRITWGDGSPVQTVAPVVGTGDATATHAYAATGSYTVQVTATDNDGAASSVATAAITVNALTTASLQALIATTPTVYLVPTSDAILHAQVDAINGLSSPAAPVNITITLGDGPYTGVTLSPPDGITVALAGNDTSDTTGTQITGASPAVTVTQGNVFVQGTLLTTATDSPTILVTGGNLTLAQNWIDESTGFNNAAIEVTSGHVDYGLDVVTNINGDGGFFRVPNRRAVGFPEGIDDFLVPNMFAKDGVILPTSHRSATSLISKPATASVYGDGVTFTAYVDTNVDELGSATGTVKFYDGATLLATVPLQTSGGLTTATYTTSSLSTGTHTIAAFYSGDDLFVATSATVVYQVNPYPFAGFFQPVDNPPTFNQVNAGAGIPFKFSLGGNRGLSIIAAGSPTSQQIQCDSGAPIDDIEQTTTSPSGLTYDASSGQYTYTWKTVSSWAGTCRQFTLRLADGTDHLARFTFK